MVVPKGHIQLGTPDDLRDYLLVDPRQFAATPANPFAAKIATGAGSYDDFENWSYWVMEDWSGGAGQNADQVANGYLFGDCATFMRGRLTLPFLSTFTGTWPNAGAGGNAWNQPYEVAGEMAIGSEQDYESVALRVLATFAVEEENDITGAWGYVFVDGVCSSVTIEYARCAEGTGYPTTVLASEEIDIEFLAPGGRWVYLDMNVSVDETTYDYWIILRPTVEGETLYVPYVGYDAAVNLNTPIAYDGTAWEARTEFGNRTFFAITNPAPYTLAGGGWAGDEIADIVRNGSVIYAYGKAYMHDFTPGLYPWQEYWTFVTYEAPAGVDDMHTWGDMVYVAHGDALYSIDSEETVVEVGSDLPANVLTAWNGYLYRAAGNQLWYTGDALTWVGPFEVGPPGVNVTGMAGMGDYLYLTTEDGLYYLAPGDFVVGIAPFPTADSANGARMINHDGSLYIPMRNRIWQFTPSGTFADVWISQQTDFPPDVLGEIHSLASTHLGLVATVQSADFATSPTVWVMQSEGWHCLAILPPGMGAGRIVNDPINRRLWFASWQGLIFSVPFEPLAVIPVRNPLQQWAPYGWMETDWYSGGLLDVQKDWESVTVFGANLSDDTSVSVYYQDSEGSAWALLGEAKADGTELRWLQDVYRPTSNKIKLGLLLRTRDVYSTPEVRAVRVKYSPMLLDRWRWQLQLAMHEDQQMLDGTLNAYSVAQQMTHLDSLVKRIEPVIFRDMLGDLYEVKVLGASKQVMKYEVLADDVAIQWNYVLSLEQIVAGEYTLPVEEEEEEV